MTLYFLITAISLFFFGIVVFRVSQQKKMYPLPKRYALNAKSVFLKRRYLIIAYFSALAIISFITFVIIFLPFL